MDGGEKEWANPTRDLNEVYGNDDLQETNVLTIQQLKDKFKNEFSTLGAYKLVSEDIQIKGYVTGNDIEGNMYNEISIQDETGGIFIGIAQGGVYGYLPIGTEILVDLKGLYVGNYRRSATIGAYYMDKDGDESVSRMSRFLWQSHFKYTGRTKVLKPELFADGKTATTWDITNDAGKLGILKNVTFKRAGYWDAEANNGTGKYFDVALTDDAAYVVPGFSTSWYFNEQVDDATKGVAVQLYNSSYADFAALKLPQGKVNITGVFKHYCNKQGKNDSWEIIIRSLADIEEVK
jgi:hypothetical protein